MVKMCVSVLFEACCAMLDGLICLCCMCLCALFGLFVSVWFVCALVCDVVRFVGGVCAVSCVRGFV